MNVGEYTGKTAEPLDVLIQRIPNDCGDLEVRFTDNVLQGTSPDLVHVNFYITPYTNGEDRGEYIADSYSMSAVSSFDPALFVDKYLWAVHKSALTMQKILEQRPELKSIRYNDQSIFGSALYDVLLESDDMNNMTDSALTKLISDLIDNRETVVEILLEQFGKIKTRVELNLMSGVSVILPPSPVASFLYLNDSGILVQTSDDGITLIN